MISPTVVSAAKLGINPESISENALNVVNTIQDAGFDAYLVGGCVRDLILGRKPKDFDVSTNATPDQIKKLFRNARIIGRRFRLVHVRFGYEVIEVATFRADATDRDEVSAQEMTEGDQGQLLRDNVYGTIEEDVQRRDFRANALYFDPRKSEILDFMEGIEDIQQARMISIGDPKQRFREDPVRMLRVIRFAAKLDFSMEQEAVEMIEEEGGLLAHVSPARLFEEVLKLFHGGAAYETYLMLRKYGLFKYLFPFTDQSVLDGVEGMPERALQNTDKRIHAGKPVIPAFLFACMLWDPVKADAQILMQDGTPESQAWRVAMNDALRDQNQYVAVPRRLAEIIIDIWNIHFRLVKRNPRMVKTCLNNRRFRAAYDFLLLRVALYEIEEEIGKWWTKVQEVDSAEREEMIAEITESHRQERQNRQTRGEADGNSIDYQPETHGNSRSPNSSNYRSSNQRNGQSWQGHGDRSRKKRYSKKSYGKKSAPERRSRNNSRSNDQQVGYGNQGNGYAAHGNTNDSYGNTAGRIKNGGPRRSKGRKRTNHSAGSRSGQYTNNRASGRVMADARPKDDYGNYQINSSSDEVSSKKVKVRRKRRIVNPDDSPHF